MKRRTASGDSLTSLILEIFRANGALIEAGNVLTNPYGLTSSRWQVLGAIDLADQPLTVSQIARRMGLSRQAVQRIVNDLVKLEMVSLEDNLDHKRAPLIAFTRKAENAMAAINLAQTEWVNRLSEGLDAAEIDAAHKLLAQINQRLNQPDNGKGDK